MKKIATLILLITVSFKVFSQEKQLEYSSVVPVKNATAKELHHRCLGWFSRNFSNSDKVLIQTAENRIIAKPILLYYPNYEWGSDPVKGTITYTFEVDFEEGKFTYMINNFVHHGNPVAVHHPFNLGLITTDTKSPIRVPNQLWVERAWNDVKYHIGKQITPLIANLKNEMAKAPERNVP